MFIGLFIIVPWTIWKQRMATFSDKSGLHSKPGKLNSPRKPLCNYIENQSCFRPLLFFLAQCPCIAANSFHLFSLFSWHNTFIFLVQPFFPFICIKIYHQRSLPTVVAQKNQSISNATWKRTKDGKYLNLLN